MELGSALFRIEARDDGFGKAIDAASKKALGLGDSLRDAGGKMVSAGSKISLGLLPVTGALTDMGKRAVDAASGTEEALSKVRVIFGDTAGDIATFADGAAKSLGMSKLAALDATGTLGNLFKGMGLGGEATRDMSKGVVTLATDLGSFNNVPTAEALDAIRSGLVGEAEPMRKFGVLLNEATVKAEAMRLGLGGVGRELTENEKVQARYSLIMAGTATAHGDFARTSDGLANSLKIQKAEQENVEAQLGTALLPVMKELTSVLTGVTKFFAGLSPEMQKVVMIGAGLLLVLGPLLTVLGVVTGALGFLASAFGVVTVVGGVSTLTIGGLSIALGALLLPLLAVIAVVALLALAWSQNWGDIQGKTQAAMTIITNVTDGMRLFMLQTWRSIVLAVSGAVNAVIGVINNLIEGYNALASRLGLPTIGKIELITPNLDAVDNAIDAVAAKRRIATIYANVVGGAGGGSGYVGGGPVIAHHSGTPFVEHTGLAMLERGEAVIPAGSNPFTGSGGGGEQTINLVVDGRVIASVVADRFNAQRRLAGGTA